MKVSCRLVLFLLMSTSASATPPPPSTEVASRKVTSTAALAESRPPPCQGPSQYRKHPTQGTLLWGAARRVESDERSSVLASIDLSRVQLEGGALKGVQVQNGRLMAGSLGPHGFAGALMEGRTSDDQPVEVAVCGAKAAPEDPAVEWYRIEVWSDERKRWENPCIATNKVPEPRVLAVHGVWDVSGAWREVPGKMTFACENGVIAKCIKWGYKPWEQKEGRSLRELHQACTRMARADYCGNGKSHTQEDTIIDIYDALRISTRTKTSSPDWRVERASFEAAWVQEGAACLARTRDGRPATVIQEECPGRFEAGLKDLGDGDVCSVVRKGVDLATAWLRNRASDER